MENNDFSPKINLVLINGKAHLQTKFTTKKGRLWLAQNLWRSDESPDGWEREGLEYPQDLIISIPFLPFVKAYELVEKHSEMLKAAVIDCKIESPDFKKQNRSLFAASIKIYRPTNDDKSPCKEFYCHFCEWKGNNATYELALNLDMLGLTPKYIEKIGTAYDLEKGLGKMADAVFFND